MQYIPRENTEAAYFVTKQIDVQKQSNTVSEDGTRRASGFEDKFYTPLFPEATTCYTSLQRSVKHYGERQCLGFRPIDNKVAGPFQWISYNQFWKRVNDFSSGLRNLGVEPKSHVGIYSKNRIDWQVASEGCNVNSFVSIALYDTLGEESSLYILNHGEVRALVVSGETFPKLAQILNQCEFLKFIITMDAVSEEALEPAKAAGIQVISMAEVEQMGADKPVEPSPPQPEDTCVIMYTSGTTGVPKGVVLTHSNLIAAVSGILTICPPMVKDDVLLSFLPLAHILEKVAEIGIMSQGGKIGFYQGDIRKILDDITELKPTLMTGVPRIYDRIYEKCKSIIETSGSIKQYMLSKAFSAKKRSIESGSSTPVWDWLVFSKFKARVGGNMRGMLSGGAPLKPEVQDFLRLAFGCPVVQGYGLTETTAGGTLQLYYDISSGNVGAPIPTTEIRLLDVPEMNYLSTNNPPAGEVLLRGPCITKGYYKQPEQTAEVFDADGWFHTGDIGVWNPNGTLSIVDRKKNIFKLSQGEYIAAENIENILLKGKWLSQLFVYGDSLKSSIVGVGVLNPDNIVHYAKEHGIPGTVEDLAKNPDIQKLVFQDVTRVAKEEKLKGFEYIKALYLEAEPFSVENNLTTPTLKLKRPDLKKRYIQQIEEMYKQIPE